MPHTPDPWTVINNTITASNGKTICTIPNNTQEDSDNAQLIAAAPKMLEAIKEIAEECLARLRKRQGHRRLNHTQAMPRRHNTGTGGRTIITEQLLSNVAAPIRE